MQRKILFLVFLLAASTLFSQQAAWDNDTGSDWYAGKTIRDIIFTGLKNINKSELEAFIVPYRGRIFSENVQIDIYSKLYALEYFDYISSDINRTSSDNEIIIVYNVIERPIVTRINFAGNSAIHRGELNESISLKINDFLNSAKVRIDVEAIKNKYIEKGYPNVNVTAIETKNADSNIILTFNIEEGEKITIKSIEFTGNSKFSNNALKGQLSLKVKSLLNNGAFQESKLIADIESVKKYYHDRGYANMIVRDVTRSFDSDDKGINLILTFLIEEGEQFTFGGIIFDGNIIFSTSQLEKLVYSKTGEIANQSRLEADLQRVADIYYENGYIFNYISPVLEINSTDNVISYKITIVERGRAYIENIFIQGNEKTKTHVILREIPLEPGDVFSKTKVMDAMRNLYNLRFFSMVFPEPSQGSAENLMDLYFTVEEQPTMDLQFGLTFSGSADPDTFPISGLIKWGDLNLAGTGNQLGIEVNSTVLDTLAFSVNYMQSWIFGLPLSGGFDFSVNWLKRSAAMNNRFPIFYGDELYAFPDGFSSRKEYYDNKYQISRDYQMEYKQWYISLGFSTGYRWNTVLGNLGLSGGIRFGIVKNIYDSDLYRPFDPALREGNNTWMWKNSFWSAVSLDQRDLNYDPSKGYYLYQRFGLNGIFKNEREHYLRTDSKAEIFFTLFDLPVSEKWSFKSVLALHSGISFILKQPGYSSSSNPKAPRIEDANKLTVDGMFIGRGWQDEYNNKGFLLWDNWVEIRFPIVPGIIALDLFLDSAGVETEQGYYFGKNDKGNPNFTIENMRFSLGGGLRFTLPQFPLRFSLAKLFSFKDGKTVWVKDIVPVISFVVSY